MKIKKRRIIPMTVDGGRRIIPMTVGEYGKKIVPITIGEYGRRIIPMTVGDNRVVPMTNEDFDVPYLENDPSPNGDSTCPWKSIIDSF